jgi:hypothetical protein
MIFVIGAIVVALGAVVAACLVRSKDFHRAGSTAKPAPPVAAETAQ